MKHLAVLLVSLLFAGITFGDQSIPDKYPESVLYDAPREVIPGVWSAIGATAPPTYENSGHNNNLSFIITSEGVVVVNAGACYLLAKALHEEIRRITDQPVRYVILENGQGHAALGSNYWREQGVPVIAHVDAAAEIEDGAYALLTSMQGYNRDKAEGTEVVLPDITFEEEYVIELGGMRIEALYLGPGHSPGDIQVWLPQQKLVISGDMAFHQRLLPIFSNTDTKGWLVTYERFLALEPEIVIPGHGVPTNVAEVTKYTRDYLVFLRAEVQKLLDEGGTLADAYQI
ncbi:MAG: MBL fold metallo-hydrolase, partial [Gammaproteobacteria bacterium]